MAKKFFVNDIGSGIVGQRLMESQNDNFEKIDAHPEMKCRDRRRRLMTLALYEVPAELMSKLRKMRAKGEFNFREFVLSKGEYPCEVLPKKMKRFRKGEAAKREEEKLKKLQAKRNKKFQGVH